MDQREVLKTFCFNTKDKTFCFQQDFSQQQQSLKTNYKCLKELFICYRSLKSPLEF